MKKTILVLLLLCAAAFPQQQDSRYFDAPFGGGGGYTPGWFVPKLDALNEQAKRFGFPELSTSGFYTSGGAGFIYIGFVPGLRIGGMGFGGSTSESVISSTESLSGTSNYNTELIYSLGGGGLTIEYSLPFVRDIGVSIGTSIGSGSVEIELFKNRVGYSWDDIWNFEARSRIPPSATEVSDNFSNSFWFITPTLNVDIPFYRFASFRIGAGYQLTFADDWTYNNGLELEEPLPDLNGNGFFIQSGIFIGFFSF